MIFLSLTNLLRWFHLLLESLTVTLTVLPIWFISDSSICSTVAFPPLWNSDHVVVSISIDFASNSKGIAPSHLAAYDCCIVDWYGFCDHFRDVPWDNIFKLGASAVAAEFVSVSRLELMYLFLIVYIKWSLIHFHGFSCLCFCHNQWQLQNFSTGGTSSWPVSGTQKLSKLLTPPPPSQS